MKKSLSKQFLIIMTKLWFTQSNIEKKHKWHLNRAVKYVTLDLDWFYLDICQVGCRIVQGYQLNSIS